MRAHDWSGTPLGPPEGWPQSLRAVVALMINSRYPMFVAWGPQLAFLYNDGYIPIFGAKHPHTLGLPFRTVWSEIWDDISPLIERALAGEATFNEDLHLVMERNGYPEDTWYSFSYSPVRDDAGAIAGMFCACAETTEKVLAERALKAERDRLSEMFEQAPGFIAMLEGPEHRFTLANAAYRRLVGGRDVVGLAIAEALPEVAGQGYFEMLDGVLASGEAVRLAGAPVNLTPESGGAPTRRYVDFVYQPVRGADGTVTGVFVEGQDVTDAMEAREAIRQREEQFSVFAQAVPSQVWASRPDGHLYWFNDQVYAYAGKREGELDGTGTWGEIVHPDDLEAAGQVWAEALATGRSYQTEFRIRRHDGVWRWFVVRAEPVRDAGGVVTGWVGSNSDIDDIRRATEAMAASEARLRFLDALNTETGRSTDADEILAITTRMVGEHLGVTSCAYADMDDDEDGFAIRGDWAAPGGTSIVGRYRLADFGRKAVQALGAGRPLIVNDTLKELAPNEAATFQAIGIGATICMPLVKNGRLTALMAVHQREPYVWTDEQLALLREVTERSWAHIERVGAEAALRDSEAQLRLVTDAMPALISYLDSERVYRFANKAYEDWFGRPAADVVGRTAAEVLGERAYAAASPYMDEVLQGRPTSYEAFLPYRDGGGRHVQARYTPDLGADGKTRGFYVLVSDVTAEKTSAAAAKESETRFRNMADHAPMMMWVTDADGACVYLNRAWYAFTGQTEEQALGFGWLDATHPEDKAEAERIFLEANADHRPFRLEYRLRRADGAYRLAIDAAGPRFGPDGTFLGYVGSVIDIEDRREAEAAVRESEARLRDSQARQSVLLELNARIAALNDPEEISFTAAEILARHIGVDRAGYGLIDRERETITIARDWNAPGVQSLAGVLNFRDYGSYIEDLKRGETAVIADAREDPRTRETAPALEAINARSFVNMPVTEEGSFVALLYLNHGERRDWTEAELSLIREVASVTRSAVERRRAEMDLKALNATLESRVRDEVAHRMQAEQALHQSQKMETVGQLTGGVAHDFNNLLTPIVGALDMLQRRPGNDERATRLIEGALTAAERAKTLVHRLLAFSRRQHLEPRAVDVGAVLETLRDLIARSLGPGIELRFRVQPGLPAAHVDPNQLELALLNLAVNARDAMGEEGTLSVTAEAVDCGPHGCVRISVTDTGAGMDAETLARAVEPFFTTKEVGRGTGLGLSSVKGLAEQSGGEFSLESEVGRGTTAILTLPAAAGPVEPDRPEPEMGAVSGGRAVILLVDDEHGVRMGAADMLTEAGYTVVEATGPAQALAEVEGGLAFDLLITDYAMPGMSGARLAALLKETRPDLPVLLTTGYASMREGDVEGLPRLAKPFRQTELVAAVRAVLRR